MGLSFDDRVKAVSDLGLPDRQARFLVTVMLHAGVCVPRQYARFAGTAYGHTVNEFFDKIVLRGYAVGLALSAPSRAPLSRAQAAALSGDWPVPESLATAGVGPAGDRAVDVARRDRRLQDLTWLATTDEKVDFFSCALPTLAAERLPHMTLTRGTARVTRVFPDKLPIGVRADGRVVFPYLITAPFFMEPFCELLQRHIHLFHALPAWTVRVLLPPWFAPHPELEAAARFELTVPLAPQTVIDMQWYFMQRHATADVRARCRSDGEFWESTHRFGRPIMQRLYRRWLEEGDLFFELLASPAIRDALGQGTGCIESRVLTRSYDHLAPRIDGDSRHRRVDGPEQGAAQPQPPHVAASAAVTDKSSASLAMIGAPPTA